MTTNPDSREVPPKRIRISEQVAEIGGHIGSRSVQLRELFEQVAPHANLLLVLIMVLPYLQPIPLPFISTASGAVVAILGFQMLLGIPAWLPDRLLRVRLAPRTMLLVVTVSSKILGFIERRTKARMTWLVDWMPLRGLAFVVIVASGVALMMPPPIFNIMPAWVIALLVIGLLERDGAFILAGYVALAVCVAYLALVLVAGVAVLDWIRSWWVSPPAETALLF